jgi:outer membrane protein
MERDLISVGFERGIASSAMRPAVNIRGGYKLTDKSNWRLDDNNAFRNKNDGSGFSTTRKGDVHGGVVVKQNLFHGGADAAHIEGVDYKIKAKESGIEAEKQKILLEVATIYFRILSKKNEVQHIQAHIDSMKSLLNVVSEREKTGEAKYAEVMEAQAGLAKAESKLANAQAEYKSLRAEIEEKIGGPIAEDIVCPQQLFDDRMGEKQAFDIALKQNPNVIAVADNLRAAKHGIREAGRGLSPSVDLSYAYDHNFDHLVKHRAPDSNRNHTVSLDVSFPLYDGGQAVNQRKQAVEAATKASIEKEKVFDEIKMQIISVMASMVASKKGIESGRVAVGAQEHSLHDTEEEYNAGVKIITNVLDAQEKLLEAKTIEVEAQKSYLLAQCRMLSLLGLMNVKGLKLQGN